MFPFMPKYSLFQSGKSPPISKHLFRFFSNIYYFGLSLGPHNRDFSNFIGLDAAGSESGGVKKETPIFTEK